MLYSSLYFFTCWYVRFCKALKDCHQRPFLQLASTFFLAVPNRLALGGQDADQICCLAVCRFVALWRLADEASVQALVRMLYLAQPVRPRIQQRLFQNLCSHPVPKFLPTSALTLTTLSCFSSCRSCFPLTINFLLFKFNNTPDLPNNRTH